METRKLGNSDMHLTPIGFGAWAIGGSEWEHGWGPQDDDDSIAAIHHALDLGMNWIDTAAVYGLGHSEEVVARALEGIAERPYVFTKCSLVWGEARKVDNNLSRESVRRECEASLRRLRVDTIDLYQIHWPNPDPDIEEGWETMAQLQQEGKLRWIAVSNFNAEQMARVGAIAPITSNQPPYSPINRKVESSTLPYCLEHNIGVINYSPMQSGLLTGAMTPERAANLPEDDWRSRDKEFREPRLSRNLALSDVLSEIGNKYGRTPGEVAIAWTLHHPAVTAAIVGARNPKQIDGIIGAQEFRLSDTEYQQVNDWIAAKP